MKQLAFALMLGLGVACFSVESNAQSADAKPAATVVAPSVKWNKLEYDFGTIPQNVPAIANFEFENTGKTPVVLSNVSGSCGCTVPEWPKEPIMPGKKSKISATYNAANVGAFTKTVTVTITNGSAPVVLTIKGTVAEKAAK
jgi:hypothetical protein